MSHSDVGEVSTHARVRLFPLPYFLEEGPVGTSPTRSARIVARRRVTRAVVTVTNRCILTLNRMYHSQACLPPPPSQPPHIGGGSRTHPTTTTTTTRRKQVNNLSSLPSSQSRRSPRAPQRLPASLSAPATRLQLRILSSVRQRCATFVHNAARSSAVDTIQQAEPSVGWMKWSLQEIIDSHSFKEHTATDRHDRARAPHGSPDQPTSTSIEGVLRLPPSSSSGAASTASSSSLPAAPSFSTASTTVVPLIARRVALPDTLDIVPLTRVLPPDRARLYSDAHHGATLLRPADEIFALDLVQPLKPARVAGARHEYVDLIRRMVAVGMVRFTSHPKAVNGVFTVGKDADQDRLIIDAQPANRLWIDSPHVALPNPSHLVQLRVPSKRRMCVGKSDLSNFYHHLGLPDWMVDYFALPPLTRDELDSLGLTDLEEGALWPACLTLPMGFSHAVLLAQSCHEHVVYSSGALSSVDNILHMREPDVTDHGVKHGIVVDDLFIFSLNRALATKTFNHILAAYAAAGFVVKPSKVVPPTSKPVKVIGFMIGRDEDDHATTVSLSTDACMDLARTTLAFLRRGLATGRQLAHIIGRWTWCMLVRRPSLAILQHAYRYVEVAHRRRFTIWPSVRRELWMLMGLLPLLHARLDVTLHPNVIASDASEFAGGVVCTRLTPDMDRRIWQLCSTRHHVHLQTLLNAADHRADPLTPDAADRLSEYTAFYTDVHAARWSTILSSSWRTPEHINALELRAVLLALHWLLSYPSAHSSRVYLLVDSTVALYALWKGRSSSAPLLLILRRISALLMASGISLLTGWLPSAVNPADEPSRLRTSQDDDDDDVE